MTIKLVCIKMTTQCVCVHVCLTTGLCIVTKLVLQACPIILASAKGHIKCVKILLNRHDVNVSMTNTVGYNCLAEAIKNGHKYVNMTCAKSLAIHLSNSFTGS